MLAVDPDAKDITTMPFAALVRVDVKVAVTVSEFLFFLIYLKLLLILLYQYSQIHCLA